MKYFVRFTKRLNEFLYLKDLDIDIEANVDVVKELDLAADKCPYSLESLLVQLSNWNSQALRIQSNNLPIMVTPCSSIKNFCGERFVFNDNTIKYFMYKFPNLQTLQINKIIPEDVIPSGTPQTFNLSAETMTLCINYISKVKSVGIYTTFLTREYMVDVINSFHKASSNNSVISIVLERQWDPTYSHLKVEKRYSEDKCTRRIYIPKGDDIYKQQAVFYLGIHDQHNNLQDLPHTIIISQLGESLKVLTIDVGVYLRNVFSAETITQVNTRSIIKTHKSILHQIIHKCPQINSLTLCNLYFGDIQSIKEINGHMQALNLEYPYFTSFDELSNLPSFFPSLKYFNITNCHPASVVKWNAVAEVNLINHQLENITWRNDTAKYKDDNTIMIYLKVSDSTEDIYLTLNGKLGKHNLISREEFYDTVVLGNTFLRVDVICVSLKIFTVDYPTFFYEGQIHD